MSEELRTVRDTLIEELRRSDTLTVAGRALFARYSAMCEAAAGAAATPPPANEPAPPPRPVRRTAAEEEEEFGSSFMVRPTAAQSKIPGYRETPADPPADLPRSLRERRR
ncbi:MAG: hypothetical protein WBA97_30035 [Actinophytocola sp.]|uniref:hypothetical protein n=1 Tax=Actinophytocola sp. TaxID=1872138 RepID=UPI003C792658